MDDEVLAGSPPLVGVPLAGEHERPLDRVALDVTGLVVLLDDREEVGQEPALQVVQLDGCALSRCGGRVVDGPARGVPSPLRFGGCPAGARLAALRLCLSRGCALPGAR